MRVTDEMVEAACKGCWPDLWPMHFADITRQLVKDNMRAALEAALAVEGTEAKPAAHGVFAPMPSVEWTDIEKAVNYLSGTPLYVTSSAEGTPKVKVLEWGEYKALGGGTKLVAHDCFGNEFARLDLVGQSFSTIEMFKRTREADYEKRVLSCLEYTTPPAGIREALGDALHFVRDDPAYSALRNTTQGFVEHALAALRGQS